MSIFTHTNEKEGKIGIGKLPADLHPILKDISDEYNDIIPDKNLSTYHTWYDELPPSIKDKLNKIKSHNFWTKLCVGKKCVRIAVNEMDELYYSNFKKTSNTISNSISKNLYGATGNIVIHKDCHEVCSFNTISLYRILIGLTNDNTNIITKFNNFNAETKINSGDYAIFDFSRTTHQVIKENQDIQTPRILLKLHFMICEDCEYSKPYLQFLKSYFIAYDNITRYILKTGTDPKTFYQFFIGLLTQFFYLDYVYYIIVFIIIFIIVFLRFIFNIKLIYKNRYKLITYIIGSLLFCYLFIVFIYWIRYRVTGIK